ncbi:hypothetical protein BSKO_02037 [Bryopsis sp. KO-2023]|nr:hypothetical protein BSKO_02037 [Bryopsis sp. KO-2023]
MEGGPSAAAEFDDEVVGFKNMVKVLTNGKSLKLRGENLIINADNGRPISLNNSEVLEGVALQAADLLMQASRNEAGDDLLDGPQLMKVANVLIDHWRLTWRKSKFVEPQAISATSDLTSAMFMHVLSHEEKLLASTNTGLSHAIECATIMTLAIDLLVVGAGGQMKKAFIEQVGRHLSESGEDGVAIMQLLFECVRMLFEVLRKAILCSPHMPSYGEGELRKFADPIGIGLISIATFCADANIYGNVVSKISKSLVALVHTGLNLLQYPVVLPQGGPYPGTISAACCKGGVELLVARCLSLLAQVLTKTSPDFLDSLSEGKLSTTMTTITKRVLELFHFMMERPGLKENDRCNGEIQLQQSVMCLLIELSDRLDFRGLLMSRVSRAITPLLLSEEGAFQERWCGGYESLLLFTRNNDNRIMVTLHSPSLTTILLKLSDAVKKVKLFDETIVAPLRTLPPTIVVEAQQYVALRSILMAHLLCNLSMHAPEETPDQFANCLIKSIGMFAKDSQLRKGAGAVWANIKNLINFLKPLEFFPLGAPVIGSNIFKSLQLLGYTAYKISGGSASFPGAAHSDSMDNERGGDEGPTPAQATQNRTSAEKQGGIQEKTQPRQSSTAGVETIVIDESDSDGEELPDSGDVQRPGSSCPASHTAVNPGSVSTVPCQEVPVPKISSNKNVPASDSAIEDQRVSGAGMQGGSAKRIEAPVSSGGQETRGGMHATVANEARGNTTQAGVRSGVLPMGVGRELESRGRAGEKRGIGEESGQGQAKVAKHHQGDVMQALRGDISRQQSHMAAPLSQFHTQGLPMLYPRAMGNVHTGMAVGNTFRGQNGLVFARPGQFLRVINSVHRSSPCPPPQPIPLQSIGAHFLPAVIGHAHQGHGVVRSGVGGQAPRVVVPQLQQGFNIHSMRTTQPRGIPEIRSTPARESGDKT